MAISSQKNFYIKDYQGHIYEIPENNLDAALAEDERNEIVEDFNPSPSLSQKNVFMRDQNGSVFEIPESNIREAENAGGIIIDEEDIPQRPELPESWSQLGARSAKSLISGGVGSLFDTPASAYNIPAMLENTKTPEMKENNQSYFVPESPFPETPIYPEQKLPLIPSATQAIDSSIDRSTNDFTKTKEGDSFQEGLKVLGAVATPGGLAKGAEKIGQNVASNVLGKLGTTAPAGLIGAGAAGAATSEASKAGYGLPASIALGLASGTGASAASKAISTTIKNLDAKIALAKLTGNSPKNIDLEAVRAAEESGLDFMNTLVNKSKGIALADQTISKTPYFGTKQAKKSEAIDKSYAEAIDNAISDVGDRILQSDSDLDIGSMTKDTFSKLQEYVENVKNNKYLEANSLLPEGAEIIPNKLAQAINNARSKIKTLRASNDETSVLNYLADVEQSIFSKDKLLKPIPVDLMSGSKRSLNRIIDWDVDDYGVKELLKPIQHAMKEDLSIYGKENPSWFKKFSEADEYYGARLGDKSLGSQTVRKKILSQKDPEKIISSLNKISDFEDVGRALEASEVGRDFFNSIKREKLSDLLMGKVIDSKTGSISYPGFSKAMENSSNKELIKYLAGNKYKDLDNFNKYAKAAIRRNQRVPNPSGTAPTKTVIGYLGAAVAGSIAGGVASGITGGLLPLSGVVLLGQALSWLANNKTALKWGIEGAKKQAQGNFKDASIYSKRIEKAMKNDLGDDFVKELLALSHQKQTEKEQNN